MTTKISNRDKILTNKFLPIVLMALNLYFFFYFICPITANSYEVLFAISGGFTTMILSFWLFSVLTPTLFEKAPIVMGLVCISTLFVFGYFFIIKTAEFASTELSTHGIFTEAQILSKSRLIGKRGNTTQSMDVSFLKKAGTRTIATILISDREYNAFQKGMVVPIIYSTDFPEIARLDYEKVDW